MRQAIPLDERGEKEPKYIVARRSLEAVIKRLEAFAATPGAKPLAVGLYAFKGRDPVTAVPVGPFAPAALRTWLERMEPSGSTPLGETLDRAATDLLHVPAASRHVLIVSDGASNHGRPPERVLATLQQVAAKQGTPVFVHIVALAMDRKIFRPLEQRGATLIGAANARQLDAQFDFILEEKILVEAAR